MRRITLRGLMARKLRLALTALAIVLGVTFVTGTLVLGDTLNRTFDNLVGTAYQHVSFQVRGKAALQQRHSAAAAVDSTADRKPVPESIAGRRSAACPACRIAFGSVGGYAQFMTRDGNAIGERRRLDARASRSIPTRSCLPTGWSRAARLPPPTMSSWTRRRRPSTASPLATGC